MCEYVCRSVQFSAQSCVWPGLLLQNWDFLLGIINSQTLRIIIILIFIFHFVIRYGIKDLMVTFLWRMGMRNENAVLIFATTFLLKSTRNDQTECWCHTHRVENEQRENFSHFFYGKQWSGVYWAGLVVVRSGKCDSISELSIVLLGMSWLQSLPLITWLLQWIRDCHRVVSAVVNSSSEDRSKRINPRD